MADGWIKLNRSIQDHWLWKDEPYDKARAWIDLIMLANWEDKKTVYKDEVVTCKRGDVNLSIATLGKRWKWDRKKVRRFLHVLESDGMITVNATTHRTTVTIVNYGVYQDIGTTNGTVDGTTDGTTSAQQVPTTKKDKKEKKDKKVNTNVLTHIGSFENDEVDSLFNEFVKMRKDMKKPMSGKAIELAISKLENLSSGNSETAIKIIEQTLEHSWQSFYELKEGGNGNNYRNGNSGNNQTEVRKHEYGISL